ncbi:MAG TPA: HD domain-containing phosphohydrolase [Gemmataceae bacterium]|nr:HD domain-containing phosphohydrolase [Gemmataceae bacterium]
MNGRRIHLEAVSPEFAGQSWTSLAPMRVGRVGDLELSLDHPSVSRHHAEIAPSEEVWSVRDLGSTNGTLLNGVRIGQAGRELRSGDLIQFGRIVLTASFSGKSLQTPPSGSVPAAVIAPSARRLQPLKASPPLAEGQDAVIQTVTALAQAVELRDRYTGGHTQRVTNYTLLLAECLGLPSTERLLLQVGVPLHDIGKIGVDDAVLRKAGALDSVEFESMRSHTVRGAAILQGIPGLAAVLPIIRSHHERWDGKGYPDGLAGEAIPLLARMVAVADAFDAMTSDRPYRKSMPLGRAFAEIAAGSGRQFDPRCAAAFLKLRPTLEEMLQQRRALVDTFEHADLATLAALAAQST